MNITNITSTDSNDAVNGYQQKQEDNKSLGKAGDIIEGIVSDVSDKVTIDFNGKEINASKSSIPDAKEGQIRRFQIVDASKDSLVLKEIGYGTGESKKRIIQTTLIQISTNAFTDRLEQKYAEQLENNEENLKDTAERMTEEDYEAAWKEGFSLEAYEAGRLTRAIERMKENKEFRSDNLDMRMEKQEEWQEKIEKIAIVNKLPDSVPKDIAKKLVEADLPLTEENIQTVIDNLNLAKTANQLSDSGMAYMISQDMKPTIDNMYHSQFSGSASSTVSEETWQSIKDQVEKVLTDNHLEVNEENMADAKWLLNHGLPITGETIEQYQSLVDLKENMTQEIALDKIIDAMKQGLEGKDANLDTFVTAKLKTAIEDFNTISEEAVQKTVEAGKELNLPNLKEAQKETSSKNKNPNSQQTVTKILEQAGAAKEEITAIRQLEEIRLKMTLESSQRLAAKGIRIDTSKLQEIVDGLKELENQYYKNLLKEAGAAENDNSIALLRETTEKVSQIGQSPAYFIGSTVKQSAIQTINTLHEAASAVKAAFDKAGEAYETMLTSPRSDLGDSIQKAFDSVDAILDDLGLEKTEDNQRAVRILGYNHMEITKDSVAEVKAYDSKVTALLKGLHPAAAVELIKRGINPIDTPIDELNSQIDEIKNELGLSDEEKYSTYLWKLEKENGISEEERKTYIGIYRLLNKVEKSDGAAIGSVLNAGQELTMSNLLTAVRTAKGKGIDTKVDDSFGGLESLTFSNETITEQINAAYSADKDTSSNQDENKHTAQYMEQVVKDILETITPAKLSETMDGNIEQFLRQPLDVIKDKLAAAKGNKETDASYMEEMTEQIRETIKNSEAAISFLEDYHMPVTVQNITAAQEFYTGAKNIFKELQKKADTLSEDRRAELDEALHSIDDSIAEKESLEEAYQQLEEKVEGILNKGYENSNITSNELNSLKLLGHGIRLTGMLSKQEHYEIPILVNEDTITSMNLTIIKGTKESGKIQIGMESNQFGKVEAEITVKEQAIKGFILCESTEGTETIRKCLEPMAEQLNELGLDVKQLTVGTDAKAVNHMKHQQSGKEQRTDTKMLYQTAKLFVQTFKKAELN